MPLKSSWQLVINELKPNYLALLGNVLLTACFGYILGQVMVEAVNGRQLHKVFNIVYPGDMFTFLWLPAIGTLFVSKEYLSWSMLTDDPFLKKMKFYRMWAIPLHVVVWGRILNMLVCLIASFIGFAAVFTLASWPELSGQLSLSAYTSYILVLFGYTAALAGINPYLEFAFNGKALLVATLVYMAGGIALLAIGAGLLGRPIYTLAVEWASAYPVVSACAALVAAGIGIGFFKWLLNRRLRRMDFF
ncbi:hypothetical protein [Paenibacillus senegalensis]|uniref:hypothetical protein n=1 Tax=Paenibacillus senegalensis TaxID=1465766 RepID=UPI000288282A|nr:hypothetical protein [Paenibacillus senegalensis]